MTVTTAPTKNQLQPLKPVYAMYLVQHRNCDEACQEHWATALIWKMWRQVFLYFFCHQCITCVNLSRNRLRAYYQRVLLRGKYLRVHMKIQLTWLAQRQQGTRKKFAVASQEQSPLRCKEQHPSRLWRASLECIEELHTPPWLLDDVRPGFLIGWAWWMGSQHYPWQEPRSCAYLLF